jgi:hypothetical protein
VKERARERKRERERGGSVRADAFLKGAGFEYAVKRDKGTVQSSPFRSSVAFGVSRCRALYW